MPSCTSHRIELARSVGVAGRERKRGERSATTWLHNRVIPGLSVAIRRTNAAQSLRFETRGAFDAVACTNSLDLTCRWHFRLFSVNFSAMTYILRTAGRVVIFAALSTAPLAAQSAKRAAVPAAAALPSLIGTWSGTATVPLPDSAIVVPVSYTFTETPSGIGGSAIVPGQGFGPISNVVRNGKNVRFRVTVKENLLDHDGTIAPDGTLEGIVNLKGAPVAKFRIAPKK